ncbi:MAG TPA: methyl-accepting chemotaxis protein, partial [Anaerolineae bacterium]|nr:methyl-accepting chemotaxis protein [Anaerolineae bacterium]
MKFTLRSIQTKIIVWAGTCLLLTITLLVAYAAISLRTTAINAAESSALAVSQEDADKIRSEIALALDAARTLAHSLTPVASEELVLSREQVNIMLRTVLTNNPQFVGVYTAWEPNTFDGQDAQYVGTTGHDETGRFIPYWSRDVQGQIMVEPLVDYESPGPGDYYLIPKNSQREALIEPYFYPIQGKEVLITSLVVPIMVNGQFFGIAGVDMRLDFLQTLVDEIDLYDGSAKMMLISHNGLLAAVTGQPELSAQPLEQVDPNAAANLGLIQAGKTVTKFENGDFSSFIPIQIGYTPTPWSLSLRIPEEKITAEATASLWRMVGIGLALTSIALVLLWFIAGKLAKPVRQITRAFEQIATVDLPALTSELSALAEGDLRRGLTITSHPLKVESQDEIGQATQAFNGIVLGLQETGQIFGRMTANLRQLIGQVAENADAVGYASELLAGTANQAGQTTGQITANIHQVSQGVQQQNEEIGQTAASVRQVSRAVENVAQGSQAQAQAISHTGQGIDSLTRAVETIATGTIEQAQAVTGA